MSTYTASMTVKSRLSVFLGEGPGASGIMLPLKGSTATEALSECA